MYLIDTPQQNIAQQQVSQKNISHLAHISEKHVYLTFFSKTVILAKHISLTHNLRKLYLTDTYLNKRYLIKTILIDTYLYNRYLSKTHPIETYLIDRYLRKSYLTDTYLSSKKFESHSKSKHFVQYKMKPLSAAETRVNKT